MIIFFGCLIFLVAFFYKIFDYIITNSCDEMFYEIFEQLKIFLDNTQEIIYEEKEKMEENDICGLFSVYSKNSEFMKKHNKSICICVKKSLSIWKFLTLAHELGHYIQYKENFLTEENYKKYDMEEDAYNRGYDLIEKIMIPFYRNNFIKKHILKNYLKSMREYEEIK